MPVPKKKTSRARRDSRRSHHAIKAPSVGTCPECGAAAAPHKVCPECGKYKGEEIIVVEEN